MDFGPQPRKPGIAVGGVADEGQVVGNRRRRHAELGHDPRLVARRVAAAVQLHDARAPDRLRQVLVGRADHDALDARVARGERGARRQRIIGLELHHRPDDDAERAKRVFERGNCARSSGSIPALVLYPRQSVLRNDSMTWSVATAMCVAPPLIMPSTDPTTPRTAATSHTVGVAHRRKRVVVAGRARRCRR